jgi:hypothetical protein
MEWVELNVCGYLVSGFLDRSLWSCISVNRMPALQSSGRYSKKKGRRSDISLAGLANPK